MAATTFTGGATAVATLTAAGGSLTGGYFQDPVTQIVYTCVLNAGVVTFVDSNNTVYPCTAAGSTYTFVGNVPVATAVTLAVDNETTPAIYPVLNNQFIVGTITYTVNVPVAYHNAATGPLWPMVNGRFIVPQTAPQSNLAYTVRGGNVIKGYMISADDQFSADGDTIYTVNAVNVVKASNQATLSGAVPNQTLTSGTNTYALNSTASTASIQPTGLAYNTATKQFTVQYNGLSVTYTVGAGSVTDSRNPTNTFPAMLAGTQLTFTDSVSTVIFTFDSSGNNPITAELEYTNDFFIDVFDGITYFVDAPATVEAISYLPETTQYAFVPADGKTYLIHYSNVGVVFPVISGTNVNVGVATVGADTFTLNIDQVEPTSGGAGIPVNSNSFELNGNLYAITGTPTPTPAGPDYSLCFVVGAAMAPHPFSLRVSQYLQARRPEHYLLAAAGRQRQFACRYGRGPSSVQYRAAISSTVNDNVYVVPPTTLPVPAPCSARDEASIAITNSGFTLSNPFDSTKAKFIFADLDIYDAGSVVGQFTAYAAPTFFIGNATYTLNTTTLMVTDNNLRPYPLLPNPTMFSINGFNYVIDTKPRSPTRSSATTMCRPSRRTLRCRAASPCPTPPSRLHGQVYKYTEDAAHNLLAITGTKSYPISSARPDVQTRFEPHLYPDHDSAVGGGLSGHDQLLTSTDHRGRNGPQHLSGNARVRQCRLLYL